MLPAPAAGSRFLHRAPPAFPLAGGRPLPEPVQAKMERAFQADFAAVRVHEGDAAPRLGALAFTRGTDIHFAPGRYDPHGGRGQALLGHELAHVVQQGRRTVPATLQAAGVALNSDPLLEREAESAGARAAQGEPVDIAGGGGAAGGPAQRAVVQRAIGFEFETGWLADRVPFDYSHDDVELPAQPPVPFAKKDVISSASFNGFRLEADEAEGGRSEIEFVVRPPIEESASGLQHLREVMQGMVKVGADLLAHADEPQFPLSRVTGAPFDDFTLVTPIDAELKAGPQATTGLDLSVVPQFMFQELVEPTEQPKFNGFLSLVQEYLGRGTDDSEPDQYLPYPKMIAEPLLARTNFARLFRLVEPGVQEYYLGHRDEWVPHVLQRIGLPGIGAKDVLARGVLDESDAFRAARLKARLLRFEIEGLDDEIGEIDNKLVPLGQQIANYQEPTGIGKLFSKQPSRQQLQMRYENLINQKVPLGLKRAGLRAQV